MSDKKDEKAMIETRLEQIDRIFERLSNAVKGQLYSMMELARLAREEDITREQYIEYLTIIERSGRTMNESIEDNMALRQIYMEDIHIHPEKIYVIEMLNRLKAELEKSLARTEISFNIPDNDILNTAVMADCPTLLLVCRNLSKRCVTMMPGHNNIEFIIVKEAESEDTLTLRLTMCYENASFTSSKVDGLALPFDILAENVKYSENYIDTSALIIRYFTHAMNAEVEVSTNHENGRTCASIVIPFPVVEGNSPAMFNIDSLSFVGKRILVADDDNINLKVIENLLRNKNADFVTVRDGTEALHTFRNEHGRFDLIIMDIIMPDISGPDVARQIRSTKTIPNARTIPIVAMTVSALHEHYFDSRDAGMNAHLVKPIEPELLYATMASLMGMGGER